MTYNIRIITADSPGLLNDANIYKKIFTEYNFDVSIYIINFQDKYKKIWDLESIDVNLFLENILPFMSRYAKVNLFMPNQEFFLYSSKFINRIDYVLCKTKIATDFFTDIKKSHNYKYRCVYTKFTTIVPYNIKNFELNKDVNLFVHLAGKSKFKNTAHLVHCWLKNNGFISIDPEIKLYITCYKSCYFEMLKTIKIYLGIDLLKNENIEHIENGIKIGNMTLFSKKSDMYDELLINNSLAICISDQEGYGHYINEARYYKSAILTVDHPPMNELVEDNMNGFTIKKLTKAPKKMTEVYNSYELYKVYPDENELTEKILFCIKNKHELINYGNIGHKMYMRDKRYFKRKMNLFIDYLINKFNK